MGRELIREMQSEDHYRELIVSNTDMHFRFACSLSHSVLSGPFLGHGLVLGLVSLEESRDVRHKRVVWVGVCQERTD